MEFFKSYLRIVFWMICMMFFACGAAIAVDTTVIIMLSILTVIAFAAFTLQVYTELSK